MPPLPSELSTLIEKKMKEAPDKLIQQISYQNDVYWLKQRPFAKKNKWHKIQKFAATCIPVPILRPTVSQGGSHSLQEESKRLKKFQEHNIPVPEIVCQTDHYLITKDCGQPLQTVLNASNKDHERERWLFKAIQSLTELHGKKLCHGRPSSKDILVHQETLFWIDLEDDPLTVMSLPEAQARDIWLLMVDFAKFTQDRSSLEKFWLELLNKAAPDTLSALKKFIKTMHPFKQLLKHIPVKFIGKEAKRAILVNTVYESLGTVANRAHFKE